MTATAIGCSRRSRHSPAMKAASAWRWATSTTTACYDLLVGAGKDHAPEVVVYSGKAKNGKNAFETELARFRPFAAGARGGISVTAAQIDGTSADNIIVGSGPGMPSEVRVYGSKLPSSPGIAPDLFSTFSPYADDHSGVSLATGFVDYCDGPLQHRHRARAWGVRPR